MGKFIENDKASKARRKKMIPIGTLSKGKAKQFIRKYDRCDIYGTYLDGAMEIGFKPIRHDKMLDRWVGLYKAKVAKEGMVSW